MKSLSSGSFYELLTFHGSTFKKCCFFHSKACCLPLWSSLQWGLCPRVYSNLLWQSSPRPSRSDRPGCFAPCTTCPISHLWSGWPSWKPRTTRRDGRSRTPRVSWSPRTPGTTRTTRTPGTTRSPISMLRCSPSGKVNKTEQFLPRSWFSLILPSK